MIDREKIKRLIKQDAIIKDVCNRIPHRDEAFGFTFYDINERGIERVKLAIDRTIDLAIEKTLEELEANHVWNKSVAIHSDTNEIGGNLSGHLKNGV